MMLDLVRVEKKLLDWIVAHVEVLMLLMLVIFLLLSIAYEVVTEPLRRLQRNVHETPKADITKFMKRERSMTPSHIWSSMKLDHACLTRG